MSAKHLSTVVTLALTTSASGERLAALPILSAITESTESHSVDRLGVVIPLDVTGIQSGDRPGSSINRVFFISVVGSVVTGIGWDVSLTALGTSWRSELALKVTDTSGNGGFIFRPGTDDSPGGPTNYSSDGQILKLANYSIPDVHALSDGLIRLEFCESFDNSAGEYEGLWNSGFLYLQVGFPTPGCAGLLAIAGLNSLRRKRRS